MSLVPSTTTNTRTVFMASGWEHSMDAEYVAQDSGRGGNCPSDWRVKRRLLKWWFRNVLTALLQLCLGRRHVVIFRRQLFAGLFSQGLFDKPACITAFVAGEAFRFKPRLTGGTDDDFNDLHAAPPICTVSLIDPSVRVCSVMLCPFRRAWILVASTA